MREPRDQIVLRRTTYEHVSLDALAASAGLHPALVECFVEFGLIEPVESAGASQRFDVGSIARLRTIIRLRRDLGANLSSVAVILELLDRLGALQRENTWLRNQR
jgi:DNA-binding transcriptional MerR regulator